MPRTMPGDLNKRRKFAFAFAFFAAAAALFLLHATDAAMAKRVLNACETKHSYCSERCIMNNKAPEAVAACIKRTCEKQNPGCGFGGDGGGKMVNTPPDRGSVGRPFGSRAKDILQNRAGQNPAAPRSPVRAPISSSGPVIR